MPYLNWEVHWAILEIRCTPPKEDMGIPKILTTFFIGKSKKKLSTFLVARVNKTWEFPKYSIIFSLKNGNSQFFAIFDIKIGNSHFLKQFLEFPFF